MIVSLIIDIKESSCNKIVINSPKGRSNAAKQKRFDFVGLASTIFRAASQ